MQLYQSENMPQYMTRFIVFACKELGIHRLRGDLHIDLKRNLEEESFGLCWGDRSSAEIQIATKQWGAPVSREDKLKTLAHELTHAYQYFTGHLIAGETDEYASTWLGETVSYTPEDENRTPWELEASDYEERIYEAWLNRNNGGEK
jgi:hypothetical protein